MRMYMCHVYKMMMLLAQVYLLAYVLAVFGMHFVFLFAGGTLN